MDLARDRQEKTRFNIQLRASREPRLIRHRGKNKKNRYLYV